MPITPILPTNASGEISQAKLSAWERTVLPSDDTISFMETPTNVIEDVTLYVLDEENKMLKIDATEVDSVTLASYADAGRAFIVSGDNKQIRQVQLAESAGMWGTVLSEPISNLAGQFDIDPLPWWKRLLSFLFSDEVKAYDQAKAMIDLMDSQEMIDAFEIMEGKTPQSEIDRVEREKAAELERLENIEKLDLVRFEAMLNEMTRNNPAILSAAMKRDRTTDSITMAFMEKVDRAAAREILDKITANPEKKEEILRDGKENFTTRLTELREFALKTVEESTLESVAKNGLTSNSSVVYDLENFTEELHLEYAKYQKQGDQYFIDLQASRQAKKAPEKAPEAVSV